MCVFARCLLFYSVHIFVYHFVDLSLAYWCNFCLVSFSSSYFFFIVICCIIFFLFVCSSIYFFALFLFSCKKGVFYKCQQIYTYIQAISRLSNCFVQRIEIPLDSVPMIVVENRDWRMNEEKTLKLRGKCAAAG